MGIRTFTDSNSILSATYQIPDLPLTIDVESKPVLVKTKEASRALAELKGVAETIPNQSILINTFALQEAKDSSAVENIITTHDELYQSDFNTQHFVNSASKEVYMYTDALKEGFKEVKRTNLLTYNLIQMIQSRLEGNNAGFRNQMGTVLKNEQTGQVIYTPPQDYPSILRHMGSLESFINNNELSNWDPLVKMAIIHHTFESIHPFFDGNGRTGRIVNILYLVKEGLIDLPILYMSRYINQNKSSYYKLLQEVRQNGNWEEWILFMLDGVLKTSIQTIKIVKAIKILIDEHKKIIRHMLPKIYSHELLNNLFSHPYSKISFIEHELGVQRKTASKYLEEVTNIGLLRKEKHGKEIYYVNIDLYDLLSNIGDV